MIYITGSKDFNDYGFFIWGLSAVLEDHKLHSTIDFGAPPGWYRRSLFEWINKIGDSMHAYGYYIYYRYTEPDFKPATTDYTVHFATPGSAIPHRIDKVFTWQGH